MPLSSPLRTEAMPRTRLLGLASAVLAALLHLRALAPEAQAQKAQRVKRAKRPAGRMDSAFIQAGKLYTSRKYKQALAKLDQVLAARELRVGQRIEDVVEAVCDAFGVSEDYVLRRGSRRNRARLAALHLCRSLTGAPVREIGAHFGGVNGQAISNLVRKAANDVCGTRS